MRIFVTISVFASPTVAFGNASGEMDVAELPQEQELFRWPLEWVAEKPTYFDPSQGLVMSVTKMGEQSLVILYGVVCNTIEEARDCAIFLEQRGGLFFDEYDHPAPSRST